MYVETIYASRLQEVKVQGMEGERDEEEEEGQRGRGRRRGDEWNRSLEQINKIGCSKEDTNAEQSLWFVL